MDAKNIQIKFSGWHKVTLADNLMTGDTCPVSGFVKKYLGGKWDSTRKGWIVDLDLVKKYSNESGEFLMVK